MHQVGNYCIVNSWCTVRKTLSYFIIKPTRCTNFANLFLALNSTCFGQFVCPSSGIYSLYIQQWCMSYSFRAGPGWNCISILVLQWTKVLVWFDYVDISAFHSCVVVDLWQSLSEWYLLMFACVLVCRRENVGA